MAQYLTESSYMRWYRQYQTSLGYYLDLLDHLRIRLDALPFEPESEEIEHLINEIDENLEKVIPRNFNGNGQPLAGFEKFVENIKVLINLVYRVMGKPDHYLGIYHDEKMRVMSVHQQFKFKDKLKNVRDRLEGIEARLQLQHQSVDLPTTPEQPIIAEG